MKDREMSIIKVVRRKASPINGHLKKIYGERFRPPKSTLFQDSQTGKQYCYIGGGIAWGNNASPGFAVVVAVEKPENDHPLFFAIGEASDKDIPRLFTECVKLRERFGYRESSEILRYWCGDYLRYATFLSDFNIDLEKKGDEGEGLYISPPVDFEVPNNSEIYLKRILSLLGRDSDRKRLFLEGCGELRGQIENLLAEGVSQDSVERWPAALALGYVVHQVFQLKPWEEYIKPTTTKPTRKDDFEREAELENEAVLREIWGDDDWDEEIDDGDTISTERR